MLRSGVLMLTIIVGCAVGLLAFSPLVLVLMPVLRRTRSASMLKGVLGVCISFLVLLLGVVAACLLVRQELLAFAVGELAGFFAGWMATACIVMLRSN